MNTTIDRIDDEAGFERLHPNARWTKRLSASIAAVLLFAAPMFAALIVASARFDAAIGSWLPWLPVVALLLGVPIGCWLADRRFARTRFRLDDSGLEIRQGLLWHRQTRVARSRIQHSDINRGPLDRRLGLATLKLYTAGTRLSSLELDGLPAERALQMRDALLDTAGDHAG